MYPPLYQKVVEKARACFFRFLWYNQTMIPTRFNAHTRRKITQYLAHARQAIRTGHLNLAHQDYIATVNRAYYAIFYAANALLATK